MLNVRLANTTLLCTDDINAIIESVHGRISGIMSETGNGALSANQLASALFEEIECYMHGAVDDMREMRE